MGFESWKSMWVEIRRQRLVLARVVGKMTKAAMGAGFDGWKAAVAESNREQVLLARVLGRMTKAAMSAGFDGWKAAIAELNRERVIIARVLGRMTKAAASRAFGGWKEATSSKRRNELVLKRILGKMLRRCLSSALEGWATIVSETVMHRTIITRFLKKLLHVQHQKIFHTWAAAVKTALAIGESQTQLLQKHTGETEGLRAQHSGEIEGLKTQHDAHKVEAVNSLSAATERIEQMQRELDARPTEAMAQELAGKEAECKVLVSQIEGVDDELAAATEKLQQHAISHVDETQKLEQQLAQYHKLIQVADAERHRRDLELKLHTDSCTDSMKSLSQQKDEALRKLEQERALFGQYKIEAEKRISSWESRGNNAGQQATMAKRQLQDARFELQTSAGLQEQLRAALEQMQKEHQSFKAHQADAGRKQRECAAQADAANLTAVMAKKALGSVTHQIEKERKVHKAYQISIAEQVLQLESKGKTNAFNRAQREFSVELQQQ